MMEELYIVMEDIDGDSLIIKERDVDSVNVTRKEFYLNGASQPVSYKIIMMDSLNFKNAMRAALTLEMDAEKVAP